MIHLVVVSDEKENQVKLYINKRLLFDKINNEHLSTSDFLDSTVNTISTQPNKAIKLRSSKQQNLNSSFDQEIKNSGILHIIH